jgi:predicted lipid-binding transport protein (Tim44 family)
LNYFDIILFAVIAGVLAVRLYRILGTGSKIIIEKKENPSENVINIKKDIAKPYEPEEFENGEGLEYLITVYPNFDQKEFISGAKKFLKMILISKYEAKKKVLISYLEDDVYRLFEKAILNKEEKGLTFHKVNIEVNTSNIKEIKVIENVSYIRVEFDFSEGVLIKNSDGTVFSDNADSPKDRNVTWTFARALNSDNPNWKLFAANQVD